MSNLLPVQKTRFTRNEDIKKQWILIDAEGRNMGRLASQIAHRLRGKHRADYSLHQDIGDAVVVVNAAHVALSGKKAEQKIYYRHTGYTGNLRKTTFNQLEAKKPGEGLKLAVKGMLPSGPLGRKLLGNLRVYPEASHPHSAQNLQVWQPVFK